MAKKDLLGGFEFKKLDGLDNGINIPISNSLKDSKTDDSNKIVKETDKTYQSKPVNKADKAKNKRVVSNVNLPRNYDFKGKRIEAMVNVVPTSQEVVYKKPKAMPKKPNVGPTKEVLDEKIPKKYRISGHFDEMEYGALLTKQEQVLYLANRGWSLRIETRRNTLYHYAIKYINRKKERIYLGTINN